MTQANPMPESAGVAMQAETLARARDTSRSTQERMVAIATLATHWVETWDQRTNQDIAALVAAAGFTIPASMRWYVPHPPVLPPPAATIPVSPPPGVHLP